MKNKKFIAIILCIGILTSSIGGSLVSLAKDNKREGFKKYDGNMDESMSDYLPTVDLIEIESEIKSHENTSSGIIIASKEEVLYEGTQNTLNPDNKDMFHIGEEEIEEMMQKGYSVADIFEADKIANELIIEPQILLEKKDSTNKSLEQIKKDILEDSRDSMIINLKERYKSEYEDLKSKNLKETEIISLIAYADINKISISAQLVDEYKKSGEKLFEKAKKEMEQSDLLQETKMNYKISDDVSESISEELIEKLEILSQKTGKQMDVLVNSYINSNSNNK